MPACKCLVCGVDLKRVTHKHVKKHGMTWAEYLRLRNSASIGKADIKPVEVLNDLADLLHEGDKLPEKEGNFQELRRRFDQKVQYLKSILSTYDISRVNRLLKFLEAVEKKLYDTKMIDTAKVAELTKIAGQLSAEVQAILTRLDKVAATATGDFGALPQPVPQTQVNIQQNIAVGNLPTDSFERERLRRAIESLMTNLPAIEVPKP